MILANYERLRQHMYMTNAAIGHLHQALLDTMAECVEKNPTYHAHLLDIYTQMMDIRLKVKSFEKIIQEDVPS